MPGPPCAASVPNLIADRGFRVRRFRSAGKVRRLMYQPLIWSTVLRDHTRRLSPALHAEDLQRLPDPLVDRVRRNAKLRRNLL